MLQEISDHAREALGHPVEAAVEDAERCDRFAVLLLQEDRAQRRRQRQRDDSGDDHRHRDGHGELPVQLAGKAAQEGDRNEHGAQRQHDRDDRSAHL
jgi:hypothetical protein